MMYGQTPRPHSVQHDELERRVRILTNLEPKGEMTARFLRSRRSTPARNKTADRAGHRGVIWKHCAAKCRHPE
jgi:hypothetical protein